MFELVRGYEPVTDAAGNAYRPRAYGRAEAEAGWSGWLVFFPAGIGSTVSSGRETLQPTYDALVRWAMTLSPGYLDGALHRALTLEPEAALADDLTRLYVTAREAQYEAELAKASAKVHELAADVDRIRAQQAEQDASELAVTAAAVEEAGATAIAEAHEIAARDAREHAAAARSRKRMAKADGAAATASRKSARRKRG